MVVLIVKVGVGAALITILAKSVEFVTPHNPVTVTRYCPASDNKSASFDKILRV